MAAKRRHWKEKGGRFYARIAVPKDLVVTIGKTEILEPLGGDRREADRVHAAAVVRLQDQISVARQLMEPTNSGEARTPITADDLARAAGAHYSGLLKRDDQKRASRPTRADIDAEHERVLQKIDAGEIRGSDDSPGMINTYTDLELMHTARHDDQNIRTRRLVTLQTELGSGDVRLTDRVVREYLAANNLFVAPGSPEWRELAHALSRAEIQALQRTLERDNGDYSGQPSDPIVRPTADLEAERMPLPLRMLFWDYISSRQILGKHRDGARQWEKVVEHLIRFLKHSDAQRITKRNLLDWRDQLLTEKKAPKTVANVYLACIRAILKWAFENDRLPTNEAETVRQMVPKKVRTRERGYTTAEAVRVLKASIYYLPCETANPSNRGSPHITAAKRWIPLLCAFTGARVTEMAQLRKEDVRQEGDHWIARITPDAGSVKSGEYRDVPMHRQVIALGFIRFVETAKSAPLFHAATSPERYLANTRVTAGRLSTWLNASGLVPEGVQPSHGWRHRFKTLGRELVLSDRTIDAIQGHAGKTAGDGYGDVTIIAKARIINAMPDYDLTETIDRHITAVL